MSEQYCPNYHISPELKVIYDLLYPQSNFEDFLAKSHSAIAEPFHVGFYDLSPEAQKLEPDLELRQFLYYLKPAADFRAYPEFVKVLRRMVKALSEIGVDLTSLAIPFESLLKTAQKIEQAVQRNYETTSLGTLFPLFRSQVMTDPKARTGDHFHTSNPMYQHGCSRFPLYSMALNNIRWLDTESDLAIAEYRASDTCNALLIAAIYLCATERCLTPISQDRNPRTLAKENLYRNPYTFLLQDPKLAPDRSKLCDMDRMLRMQSQSWPDLSKKTRHQLERIINRPYSDLVRVSGFLLINPIFDEPIINTGVANLKLLLQFFSETRKVHGSSGKGGGSGGSSVSSAGNHTWEIPPQFITEEEDLYGDIVEVYRLPQAPISKDRLKELEELGEDPYEDEYGEPPIEVLFMADGKSSQLKLDKHTSHTQLLQASKNQDLCWNRITPTHEEMQTFLTFIRSQPGIAPQILLMVAILAVDLDMVLSLEVCPEQEWDWLRGQSRFKIGGTNDTLRACSITGHTNPFEVWVYPIPVHALHHHANIDASTRYQSHTSAIPFTDFSGVAKKLIDKQLSSGPLLGPVAAFSNQEKIDIAQQCKELIKEFNRQQNGGVKLTAGKRNISIEKIRQYSKSYLINLGFDSLLVDALDWKVPDSKKPALHYYTSDLWQKPKHGKWGLQYYLANRTTLLEHCAGQPLPGIKNHTIFATGLVKPEIVKAYILALHQKIATCPEAIHSKGELVQFVQALNAYSQYVAFWFCLETSHRPHHIPFGDVFQIDPLHGFIKLKDKSDAEGNKFRLAWLSEALRLQMFDYAYTIDTLISWARQQDIEVQADLLIFLEFDQNSSKHLRIKPLDSSYFAKQIGDELQVEANFYRKLLSDLLREGPDPVSPEDVDRWLGHWMTGTAPFHLFTSTSPLSLVARMQNKIKTVISSLGFHAFEFRLPNLVYDLDASEKEGI
jgi:hypothetical protein